MNLTDNLSNTQKEIMQALNEKDIEKLKTFDWCQLYSTIQTLQCLGLTQINRPIYYFEQLEQELRQNNENQKRTKSKSRGGRGKGNYIGIASADFDTEDEWYYITSTELVTGCRNAWNPGEDIPCRKGIDKILFVYEGE